MFVPFALTDRIPVEAKHLVRRLLASCSIAYAIVNSIESRVLIQPLASAFVPVVSLIHEFASYTFPKGVMGEALDWSTEIVFSSDMTADSAKSEYSHLANRTLHVLRQGRCEVPRRAAIAGSRTVVNLRDILRPHGSEDALLVLGAGFVHIRKGVDLFLSTATAVFALNPKRPVRFIWIGDGYLGEGGYSPYLSEQIARSGLEGKVAIIGAVPDPEPLFEMTDVFLLSSRLDPLPNVAIDAAFHGLPIVCFENASGMAPLLAADSSLRQCVVPYLDTNAAARVITQFADNEAMRAGAASAVRHFAEANFDMSRYTARLDELGREAAGIMRQRTEDFVTLRDDPLFDDTMFQPPNATLATREQAIRQFVNLWMPQSSPVGEFRRPTAGFHPQIYAQENSQQYDIASINSLAHYIRSGRPVGPWTCEVINPINIERRPFPESRLRVAIHAHFYYPELVLDFLSKIEGNRSACDLLLTTDDNKKATRLREAAARYARGKVLIRVVPNRGRDIGPLLTALAKDIAQRYDVIGHIHGKRSAATDGAMGDTWREFLWQNLLGDMHPMMDFIVERFSSDETLGMVFPCDPHLRSWDDNRSQAERLAKRMGITKALPSFFEFPLGTMFWSRVDALKPLFDLRLGWNDYPKEPVPYDGTILHALERLLSFAVQHAGYRFAMTHVPGMTR